MKSLEKLSISSKLIMVLPMGLQTFVAIKSRKSDAGSIVEDELLANQYGGKEQLKSIHDHLIAVIKEFGDDIVVAPKKDSASIIRKRQFALIKPATKTRIDLGLKIKDKSLEGRLEHSGPFGTMCTHRIRLSEIQEIDQEVMAWLQDAYDQSV